MKKLLTILALSLASWTVQADNELNLSVAFQYTKAGVQIVNQQSGSLTVSGTAVASGNAPIAITDTTISLGSVTNPGVALLINGTTNSWSSISYGTSSNNYPFVLPAGKWALVSFNTNALHAISATNTPDLYYIILSK